MRRPAKTLPLSLLYGTLVIAFAYLAANFSYYSVLTPSEIATSSTVAADATGRLAGPIAARAISFLILISVLGSLNGMILTGPRVYYAMAEDGLFPHWLAYTGRFRTPIYGLLLQGVWSALLTVSATYQQLFTDVIFSAWIFYGLTVGGVVVLRRRGGATPIFRVPGYPWTSVIFCAASLLLAVSTVVANPLRSLRGIVFILLGIPVYGLFRHLKAAAREES